MSKAYDERSEPREELPLEMAASAIESQCEWLEHQLEQLEDHVTALVGAAVEYIGEAQSEPNPQPRHLSARFNNLGERLTKAVGRVEQVNGRLTGEKTRPGDVA